MKISKILVWVAVSSIAGVAAAQTNLPSKPEHGIPDGPTLLTNVKTASTGSMLKRRLRWKSNIPLNKTYAELTPEQKAEFHSLYVDIPEGSEPPYPIRGLSPVFKAIQQGQDIMQARGELDFSVTVDPEGKATYVESHSELGGPNAREMANYVASVFMMAKYKPAACQGKPCTMQFPFKLKLD